METQSLTSILLRQGSTIFNGRLLTYVEPLALVSTIKCKAKLLGVGGLNAATLPSAHICATSFQRGSCLDASSLHLGVGLVEILRVFVFGRLRVQMLLLLTLVASLTRKG